MTPDELRRMDNDLCIIYEKGLKPIKDEKYYYFETPMVKKLSEFTLNHLEFEIENRGKWRKFNPYNPYTEDEKDKPKDLKVESLDDLFEEDDKKEEVKNNQNEPIKEEKQENLEKDANKTKLDNDYAPILPQEDESKNEVKEKDNESKNEDIMSVDVQKELEAKFDELFGSFDEEDNK